MIHTQKSRPDRKKQTLGVEPSLLQQKRGGKKKKIFFDRGSKYVAKIFTIGLK